jgi:hypothetical protein
MKTWRYFTFHLIHAVVLIAISLAWMNTPYSYGDEEFLVKWSSYGKRMFANKEKNSPQKDFIFINLAHEKELISLEDQLGNEVITDREKLAQFFEITQRNPNAAQFILCDVFLKGKSEHDSLLMKSIERNSKIVFPTHFDSKDSLLLPDLKIPFAIADYKSSKSNFFKFKIKQNDSIATVPMYMYQQLFKPKNNSKEGYFFSDGPLSFNSIIITHDIERKNLFETGTYPVINLSELLILPENVIVDEFLTGKIIVMGDFQNDMHQTILGKMPGSLILVNVFLSLVKGYHYVKWQWLLFLYLSLFIFSNVMIKKEEEVQNTKKNNWLKYLIKSSTILAVISIFSYLFFNVSIQILVLIVYINLVIYLRNFYLQSLKNYKKILWPKIIFAHLKKELFLKIKTTLS